jgi:hypothetical protein
LAFAATLSVLAPSAAEAGNLCNRLVDSSPCVSNSDLKPSLKVGSDLEDGRLRLRRIDGKTTIELNGSTGNVTNRFSDIAGESNGLVKAWAAINADGTIAACWRCNRDTDETRRFGNGDYEVDFTPLSPDIRERPRIATVSGPNGTPLADVRIINRNVDVNGDPNPDHSSVHVVTANAMTGAKLNAPFVILIY